MKKRLTMTLMAAALSLTALTGCGGSKEAKTAEKAATTEQETAAEETVGEKKDAENVETENTEEKGWHLDKEAIESAPEGSVFLAPALDADGNYPEDFDMESYDGIVGNIYGTEEERAEAEKKEKESKNKKEDSKEKKDSEKNTTKESEAEKKEDSKKKE